MASFDTPHQYHPPVAGAERQDGGLDPAPIEPLDREDAPYIEQIARSTPVEQRHDLPVHDLVEVENENARRPNAARIRDSMRTAPNSGWRAM